MSNAVEKNAGASLIPASNTNSNTSTRNNTAEDTGSSNMVHKREMDAMASTAGGSYDTADHNNSTSIISSDNQKSKTEEFTVSHNSDKDSANINQSMAKNMDANKASEKGDQKNDDDDGDNDDSGPGVKTCSGYVPISQIQWEWEPPTFPSNKSSKDKQTKPSPPPNPPCNTRSGIPDEKVVYTDVGEKLRPSPYIYEIKKRKFEKKPKNKLFVGGLVFEATKEFLYDQFEKYGKLQDACIVTERSTGRSRGFGYVTFVNQEDAKEAIKAIDGLRINGKTLCVEFADDPKDSPPGPRHRSRSPPRGRFYDDRGPPRGRGFAPPRGRDYDMDRYPDRDPYYDRYPRDPDPYYRRGGNDPYYSPQHYDRLPPPRDYDRPPPPRDYDRPPPPRDYDRPPPPRDYDRFPPTRDYDRPPPRDYDRPPPRGYDDQRRYDHSPPPRGYDDYRRPPPSYDDPFPPPRREASMRDVDFARLRVDREKVRISAEDERRLQARRPNKRTNRSPSSSSSSDSSDSANKKPIVKKKQKVLPKAYRL